MTIHTISKQIITNIAIVALFALVFVNHSQSAFAQVNPGGLQSENNQGAVYQDQTYSNYSNQTNTSGGVVTAPLVVVTYQPSYAENEKGVNVTLKGHATVSNSRQLSNVWFEWGETQAMENKTSSQSINVSFLLQTIVSNLPGNKTYYYRMVGQSPQGTVRGETITMRTPSIISSTPQKTASVLGLGVNTTKSSNTSSATSQKNTTVATKSNTPTTTTAQATTNETKSNTSSNTNTLGSNNLNQTALSGANNSEGLFPNTFLGWVVLSVLVFLIVGFVLYVIDLFQEIKKKQEEEAKRRANGNGVNGNHNGIHAQA
jgi:hypothetical protein